jgi:hypothetical protein
VANERLNLPRGFRNGFYYERRLSFYKAIRGLDLTAGHRIETPANLEDAKENTRYVLVGAPGFEPGASCAQGLVARRINNLHHVR